MRASNSQNTPLPGGGLLLYSIGLLGLAQGSVLSPSRKRFRSSDLQVMSLTRCLCATLLLRSYGGSRLFSLYSLQPVISFTGAQAPIRIRTGVSGFKVPSDNHYTIGAKLIYTFNFNKQLIYFLNI